MIPCPAASEFSWPNLGLSGVAQQSSQGLSCLNCSSLCSRSNEYVGVNMNSKTRTKYPSPVPRSLEFQGKDRGKRRKKQCGRSSLPPSVIEPTPQSESRRRVLELRGREGRRAGWHSLQQQMPGGPGLGGGVGKRGQSCLNSLQNFPEAKGTACQAKSHPSLAETVPLTLVLGRKKETNKTVV